MGYSRERMFAAGLALAMNIVDMTCKERGIERNFLTVTNQDANFIEDSYELNYLAIMKFCEENNISLKQHFSVSLNNEYNNNPIESKDSSSSIETILSKL